MYQESKCREYRGQLNPLATEEIWTLAIRYGYEIRQTRDGPRIQFSRLQNRERNEWMDAANDLLCEREKTGKG